MAKNKKETTSIITPTEAELKLYNQLLGDLTEEQLDEMASEYFDLVQQEKANYSFPRHVINKLIRPVKPGDTISFVDENNETQFLFCLIRKDIEDTTYLLFSMVDKATETLLPEQVYLFYVCGYDENGIEEMDIMKAGEEAERILNIMEDTSNEMEVAKVVVEEIGDNNGETE